MRTSNKTKQKICITCNNHTHTKTHTHFYKIHSHEKKKQTNFMFTTSIIRHFTMPKTNQTHVFENDMNTNNMQTNDNPMALVININRN